MIIRLKKAGAKLEHQGISVSFIGLIELNQDRGNHHEFASLVKDLAKPGELTHNASYSFEFVNVEKPHESYTGRNVNLRYFIRVKILRKLTNIIKENEIIVHTLACYPEVNSPIKMEVGIEDCLHIEFEYNKSKYHLKDVIVGKIYFLLVRIKIKHMEIAIIKKEITGINQNTFNENETIAKYEIMDGAPVRGESIPIRLFLGGYELTPTLKEINKKFSVKYYLNLVIVDEEDRRYFKQQEIVLWRKGEKLRKPLCQQQVGHIQAPQYQPVQISQITSIGQVAQQQNASQPVGQQPASAVQQLDTASPKLEKENIAEHVVDEPKELVIEKETVESPTVPEVSEKEVEVQQVVEPTKTSEEDES